MILLNQMLDLSLSSSKLVKLSAVLSMSVQSLSWQQLNGHTQQLNQLAVGQDHIQAQINSTFEAAELTTDSAESSTGSAGL